MGEQTSKRRDYTNEIIATAGTKFKYVPQPTEAKKKKSSFKKKYLLVLPALLIIAVVSPLLYFLAKPVKSTPIPQKIEESVAFKLYYPSKLPSGYYMNKNSFSQQPNVVTYYAQNHQGQKIFFSIQPVPEKVSIDDFNKRVFQNSVNVLSNAGQAAVGKVNNIPTASLITDKSWVLITSPTLSTQSLSILVSSLKQV